MKEDPIIQLKDITVGYKNKPAVLNKVNLSVFEQDFLGVIGPNGGGKTTLLRTILGLLKPSDGTITYSGTDSQSSINIGYLPQTNQIDRKFPISVHQVILSGLPTSIHRKNKNDNKLLVEKVAEQMGISSLLNRSIEELSGGQLQRALLGRAIIDSPRLLILDEPNSYVDKQFESGFYTLLEEINKQTAIILVSHDVGTVISMVKNIACVNQGLHYHSGAEISTEWLAQTYTSCPIEIVGHGEFPHRVLGQHNDCDCCSNA